MHTTPRLQAIVTQIATRYGIDLLRTGAYLRLHHASHGQLVLENIGAARVSITNYITVSSDWVSEPEVVLYTDYRTMGQITPVWIPLECTQFFRGWRLAGELDPGGALLIHSHALHAELVAFCEDIVAKELRRQDWLNTAVQVNTNRVPWSDEEIHARDIRPDEPAPDVPPAQPVVDVSLRWPAPTTDEPDFETLEEWLWQDGGCESSDGCWTDPDGYCPHGHPSWMLRLGLI